jgi:hypothetical protein
LPSLIPLSDLLSSLPEAGGQEPEAIVPEAIVPEAIVGLDHDLQPARLNLQRHGPHFAIVGPPLSGKTTALYNWVLSLAFRHSPQQIGLILFDHNRKFATYGGRTNLGALPHVLAVLAEVTDLPHLVAQLAAECQALAERRSERRLFLILDNFDDFCEEVDREREAADALGELALLANRHGTDGLHVVIAGALDTPSSLKSRVLAGGYGIGLRNADSLVTLRAYTRNFKDLPAGRGFIANAGQLTKLQIAQPYSDPAGKAAELDGWVATIGGRWPDAAPAQWTAPLPREASDPAAGGGATVNGQIGDQAYALLKLAIANHSAEQGLPLADLGLNLDEMEHDDVLRLAETYFT